MSAYLGSTKVWDSSATPTPAAEWVRPSDWLAMPTIAPTEQRIVGLHCIWPTDGNFCALTCSGAYTVDWGDGMTENVASGVQANHEYSYSDADLNSATVVEHGYKQALVTITPQSGQNLTSVNFFVKHNQSGLANGYSSGWLDIALSAPNATSLTFGGATTLRHGVIERFVIVKCGSVTTLSNAFNACSSLQSVDLSGLAGAPITSLSATFQNCYSLQSIDLSPLAGAPITTLANAFNACALLQSIDLTPLAGAPITTLSATFQSCASLQSIDLSPLAGAPITTLANAFNTCSLLQSIDLTPLAGAPITAITSTFNNCYSLAKLFAPVKVSFGVTNCRLSGDALNALYSSLGTGVTGQTVTVTGNYGVATDNPALVPTGWTVTG